MRSIRFVLAALLSLLFIPLGGADDATAQQRFSRVVVDVSPMRARGAGPFGLGHYGLFVDRTQQVMTQEAARVFAGVIDPRDRNAPVLVIRIDSVQFGDGSGGDADHRGVSRITDYMQGAGLVVVNGKVVKQVPMLGAYDSVMGPSIMLADNAGPRLQGLSAFYAGWLKRKMGI
jgi:hypothetical protein